MAVNKTRVPVIGFSSEMLANWPADLQPDPAPPTAGSLVVVHASAFAEYTQSAGPMSDADRPPALLFLDAGAPPQNAWRFFDGVLRPGEWDKLRAALECPRGMELAELAEEIPVDAIAPALKLLATAPYESGALDALAMPDDTDPALRGVLAQHKGCREDFVAVLRERQAWLYRTLHPPIEHLSAFAFGETDPWVTTHLASCATCATEVDALRLLDAPAEPRVVAVPASPLLEIPLNALRGVALSPEKAQNDQLVNAFIADLAMSPNDLQPLAPWSGLLSAATENEAADTLDRGSLLLIGMDRELTMSWSLDAGVLTIQDLRVALGESVAAFTALLEQDGAALWQANSLQGSLSIPLSDLTTALQTGAQMLRIVSN